MPNLRIRRPRVGQVLLLGIALLLVAGCTPVAVTSQGQEISDLYYFVFVIAAIIFFFVEGLIVFAVLRYRRKPTDTALPVQTHGNNALEIIWTVIPTVIVAVLFLLTWNTLNHVDVTNAQTDIQIRAVAQRFQWSFEYLSPDGQTVLFKEIEPEMTVPAGPTIHLLLSSPDVIHAFYVPQFLFKRDVVPGKENSFDFNVNASDAGQTFRGQCAELCGTFHDSMQFQVKALTPADYQVWFQQQVQAAQNQPSPPPASGPPPSGGAGQGQGPVIELTAKNIAFEPTKLTAPADTPFTIKFDNEDAGVPHDVLIHSGPDPNSDVIFDGEIFNGVATQNYPIPALKKGNYAYSCKVHPTMTGTLTVQ